MQTQNNDPYYAVLAKTKIHLGAKYIRAMQHGRKRHRKKMAKLLAALPERYAQLGAVIAETAKEELQRPGFAFRLWAPDDEYLAWENAQHPWWTRTKR